MIRYTLPAFVGVLVLIAQRQPTGAAPVAEEIKVFSTSIQPMLKTYCIKCHNNDTQEGGVNYAAIRDDSIAITKRGLWKRAFKRIESGEMPPEGAKPLAPADKESLVRWMKFAAEYVDCDPSRRDPGPSIARRLTRTEYNLTVRDLFGFPFDSGSAVGMPEDGGGEHFDNLAADLSLSPVLIDKYFAAAEKITEKIFATDGQGQQARQRLFIAKPDAKLSERDAAKQIITKLIRRAFRKPARPDDIERLLTFFDRAKTKGESFENAVRAMLKPVLVSPQFLFRIEESPLKLSDDELAVRLSYFLWSTMPDDALFIAAESKKLSDPAEVERQVQRMLSDPKGRALTDQFAVQWLQLRKLANARPTTEFFPTFKGQLRQAMFEETTTFFDDLRQNNRSVLNLLDANYTFVNDVLAEHYGIAGISGPKMQRVELDPKHHRGGVISMASVLALTSHTFRTSPTQRGKYVLEVIFGTPPPPPPPNAGMLKDDMPRKKIPLTFREQLHQHANQASCAGCHRKIDPLGFALDNYNPIGAWRDSTADNPLDVSGVLPGGEKINGVADLKRVFMNRKDEFAHHFIEKMLMYALGRELELSDECTVREILAILQKNEYRFGVIITEIVKSNPFRQRRAMN